MLPFVRINGKLYSRASTTVRLNGAIRIPGVDTINYSDEVPVELVPAMGGGVPLGSVEGNYACASDISIYKDEAVAFQKLIAATNPAALGALVKCPFFLIISYVEDVRVTVTVLANAVIKGRSNTVGNDGSALAEQFTLQPYLVTEDGLSLVSLVPQL